MSGHDFTSSDCPECANAITIGRNIVGAAFPHPMTEYGIDEDRFWTVSPAAIEIFRHVETHPDLKGRPWTFHDTSGFVALGRTGATFSRVGRSGSGMDTVFVVAELESDGTWVVQHRIKEAR